LIEKIKATNRNEYSRTVIGIKIERGMVASSGKFIIKTVLNISIKAVQRNDIRTIIPDITFFSIIF
tara:strand:- start:108 stop:305 length:198 start_codon:yes stop_codon:yes gene_type:complete